MGDDSARQVAFASAEGQAGLERHIPDLRRQVIRSKEDGFVEDK
jgi:hypothetical protein